MSIQTVPSLPPLAEPVQARPRAAAPEVERERDSFTLPEAPVETPAPTAAKKDAPRADAEAAAPTDEPAAAATRTPPTVTSPATEPGQPAQAGAGQSAPVPVPVPEVSALFALAVAAQSVAVASEPGDGSDVASKDGEETAPEAAGTAGTASLAGLLTIEIVPAVPVEAAPDATAAPPAPVLPPDTVAISLPFVAASLLPVANPLPAAGEGDVSTAAPAAFAIANATLSATPSRPARAGAAQPAGIAAPDSAPAASDAGEAEASVTGAKPPVAFAAAFAQPGAVPADPSNPAAPEVKLGDILQPALAPIDLSATGAVAFGRAETVAGVAGAEAAEAAQPGDTRVQGQAGGQPTPLHVVPIEIGLRLLAGSRKFDIRLDPAELGRVDVNLEISDKGEVTAKLVVDRVETLHLLQRDARTLERAFEQAGLKPSDGGVDITLRDPADQSGFRQNRQQDDHPRRATRANDPAGDPALSIQPASIRRLVRLGGVDLSI